MSKRQRTEPMTGISSKGPPNHGEIHPGTQHPRIVGRIMDRRVESVERKQNATRCSAHPIRSVKAVRDQVSGQRRVGARSTTFEMHSRVEGRSQERAQSVFKSSKRRAPTNRTHLLHDTSLSLAESDVSPALILDKLDLDLPASSFRRIGRTSGS